MNAPRNAPRQGRRRYPLARRFPRPGPQIVHAYLELDLVLNGDDKQRKAIGEPSQLPRPWDPSSIETVPIRTELWEWLEAVVEWINTEHVWDPSYLIPPCWPQHPHLVHEIAVLADQRYRAGYAIASDALGEWHRFALPGFFERCRTRLRTACDSRHHDWPARPSHVRFQGVREDREQCYVEDVEHLRRLLQPPDPIDHTPRLQVVDGHRVDMETGEIQ